MLKSPFYYAATNGKIEAFKDKRELDLLYLVTPNGNIVLHVCITSKGTEEKKKTNFEEKVLKIYPTTAKSTKDKKTQIPCRRSLKRYQ